MKTTIELDEKKLENVMRLKGFKTRKAALDYALSEGERRAKIDALLREPPSSDSGPWIAPDYDYKALRRRASERGSRKPK